MKKFVFRNTTVEPLFAKSEFHLSGYDDITFDGDNYESYVWCYFLPIKLNKDEFEEYLDLLFQKFEFVCSSIPKNKMIIALTLEPLFFFNIERYNSFGESSIIKYNRKVFSLTNIYKNLKLINFGNFLVNYEMDSLMDWKFYHVSMIQLNPKLSGEFKNWLRKEMDILAMKRKKCLVLDLDNTLWGGILGEDGIGGIKIGGDYPGNAYRMFQELILELKETGVILAVCSKNNESDVLDAWKNNKEILITGEHLAAYRINWNNKADNIYQISKELNIGLDSMVFIDDNPVERELVKQSLPEVEVPDFPRNPYEMFSFANNIIKDFFITYKLTNEDLEKTNQYKQNKNRANLANRFSNNEDFLKSLGITISLIDVNEVTLQRFSQMCNKTNQFNFTTKRYSEQDIQAYHSQGALIQGLSVKDKFGDNGITGLIIAKIISPTEAIIDTFLLSCRVLGKGVEFFYFSEVLKKLKERGVERIQSIYIASAKNSQVKSFYSEIGFELVEENQNGDRIYAHELNKNLEKLQTINYITLE
jgi:FkbH-like protein